MANTDLTRRDHGVTFERVTTEDHEFHLQPFRGYVLEVEDVHFHHDSAVLLPNYDVTDDSDDADPGLSVLVAALVHQHLFPKQTVLITGHADTSGPDQYNIGISIKRAKAVLHAIMGERAPWVAIAESQHKVEDYQLILTWIADTKGWDCDPEGVDNVDGPATRQAVKNFQTLYNDAFDANIATDGAVGKATWGAIFDVYMDTVQNLIRTNQSGLTKLRAQMNFLGPKVVGCGETGRSKRHNGRTTAARSTAASRFYFLTPARSRSSTAIREGARVLRCCAKFTTSRCTSSRPCRCRCCCRTRSTLRSTRRGLFRRPRC